jgi:hypothetical protein
MRLYMILLGCKPEGRFIEQHDVFFGVGASLEALIPQLENFWPNVKLHIDSWREVTVVDNHRIAVIPKKEAAGNNRQLFFFNLGGYKENDLEEFHYKVLTVADDLSEATKNAKDSTFYKHTGFKGANSHIDDKYGIDIDDVYKVADLLDPDTKAQYTLQITRSETSLPDDGLHIGYLPLGKLKR